MGMGFFPLHFPEITYTNMAFLFPKFQFKHCVNFLTLITYMNTEVQRFMNS